MKTMNKSSLCFMLSFLGLFFLSTLLVSCDNDDEPQPDNKTALTGTWQAIPTNEYTPWQELTIEFKADQTIHLYTPYQGDSYNLVGSKLEIIKKGSSARQTYDITFNEDQTITIYNFQDGTDTLNIKNITFKKV